MVVHGDDFIVAGYHPNFETLDANISAAFKKIYNRLF